MSYIPYTKEEICFLRENIDKFGVAVCAEKLGRTQTGVMHQCYRKIGYCCYECKATDDEIKNLKYEYKFEPLTIDFSTTKFPKELAYFLGYFWADGYIRKDGSLVMEIIKEDADNIEPILSKIVKFRTYERTRPNKNTQKTFYYHDYGRKISNCLKELGKYSSSIESHKKIIEYIPECYINHFLRGLIDGDGNLYVSPKDSKQHCTQITIAGRNEQDWDYLVSYIGNKYGLKFKTQNRSYKSYKSSSIRATDKTKIIDFLGKVYGENDGIHLPRKYNKIKILMENIIK